ncbi:MAG: glycosyltransferase family 2 protein [Gammaproteobacteria bacterium]
MKSSPDFSVIIAVYNGGATLARAIDSVLAQSYPPLEIMIVDDGSTDNTATVAQRYGESVRYFHQNNAGVSAARNAGARIARGEWLAFLDADDWYYPERLRWHADWIRRDPGLDFLTGDFEYRRSDGSLIGRSMEKTVAGQALLQLANGGGDEVVMEGELLGLFVEQHFGDTHTLSLRRDTFLELGGYPEGIAVCEDVNLLIRLVARSRRVGVICQPMAVYLIHGTSATRSDPLRAQRQTLQALSLLRPQLVSAPATIRKGLLGALRHARLDLSYVLLRQGRKLEALSAISPLLWTKPGLQSLKDLASILRG